MQQLPMCLSHAPVSLFVPLSHPTRQAQPQARWWWSCNISWVNKSWLTQSCWGDTAGLWKKREEQGQHELEVTQVSSSSRKSAICLGEALYLMRETGGDGGTGVRRGRRLHSDARRLAERDRLLLPPFKKQNKTKQKNPNPLSPPHPLQFGQLFPKPSQIPTPVRK